ncbi:PadR family transcriptional regulator [Arcanobacterium haemolyticum]|nr:PadR family transcriptional regulator [Arcanobacterium haemolyticum]
MIEMLILGFLAESPAHGYELRQKMCELCGHSRSFSEGTLYPAIARLEKAGYVRSDEENTTTAGNRKAGRKKKTLHITADGRTRLHELLRHAHGHDITDLSRWFVVLAFLSFLPSDDERRDVLRRRLEYVTQPSSFFYANGTPLTSRDVDDPYRRGIMTTAKATRQAETRWLRQQLEV